MAQRVEDHWQFSEQLKDRLRETWANDIPLARFMRLQLDTLDATGLRIRAPLDPSRNHMGTGFAGALQTAMTLAGWGLTAALLDGEPANDIVAQSVQVKFLLPVQDDFEAVAVMPDGQAVEGFLNQYRRRGRARLHLRVRAMVGEDIHALGEVAYAAIPQTPRS
ncbi:MAG: YiiD C-terminal domain-containing protein [Pseudomonadota bacterium]